MASSRLAKASGSSPATSSAFHRFRISRPPTKKSSGTTTRRVDAPADSNGAQSRPACHRCKQLKKKCSRTTPKCDQCDHSAAECTYPAHDVTASIAQLEAKIERLTQFIAANIPASIDGEAKRPSSSDGCETVGHVDAGGSEQSIDSTGAAAAAEALTQIGIAFDPAPSHGQADSSAVAMPPPRQQTPPPTTRDTLPQPSTAAVLHPMSPPIHVTRGSSASSPSSRSIVATAGSVSSADGHGVLEPMSLRKRETSTSSQITTLVASSQSGRELPPDAACYRFVDAYFRHVHRVYPFIDRNAVHADLQNITDMAQYHTDSSPNKLYLIMAIGCTTLQRSGQVPVETSSKFRIPYSDVVAKCLAMPSTESVETLFLLSLYSLFDPAGISPWLLVGILTRQAVAVGITRKAASNEGLSSYQAELRHRLYWSIFVLDRMLSTSLGLPVGLTDDNSDVPLPGITLEELEVRDQLEYTNSLQVCRHVIQLRQTEEAILKAIHLANSKATSMLSPSAKDAITCDLRSQIENWYSNGCLISPNETDNIPFHNTINWLTVRYYNLLILLYSPSHFTSLASPEQYLELQRFAQKYVQSSCVLLQQRQLPLNWITLYRFLSICSIFLYCFVRTEVEQGKPFLAQDEVLLCAEILESFPTTWVIAARSALIFRQFASLVSHTTSLRSGPLAAVPGAHAPPATARPAPDARNGLHRDALFRKWFTEVNAGSMGLVREVLGRNSAFGFTDYLIEHAKDWSEQQLMTASKSMLGFVGGAAALPEPGRVSNVELWEYDATPAWDVGMEYF